jgi:hypothetical protein
VAGGPDTHLALLDLQETGVTGADAENRCDAAGIVLNKNAIPFDPQPASIASGIRVGSPAVTTQGMVRERHEVDRRAHRDGDPGRRRQPHRRGRRRCPRAGRSHPRIPSPSEPADPMREYAVVLLTAALVTFLATPVVRMVATRFRMMAAPARAGRAHHPDPAGGGVAMYLGVAAPSSWPAGCRRCSGPSMTRRPTPC